MGAEGFHSVDDQSQPLRSLPPLGVRLWLSGTGELPALGQITSQPVSQSDTPTQPTSWLFLSAGQTFNHSADSTQNDGRCCCPPPFGRRISSSSFTSLVEPSLRSGISASSRLMTKVGIRRILMYYLSRSPCSTPTNPEDRSPRSARAF